MLLAGLGIAAGDGRTGSADITDLSVTIEVENRTHRYGAKHALDLGDYTDPLGQFVQGCALATHPALRSPSCSARTAAPNGWRSCSS